VSETPSTPPAGDDDGPDYGTPLGQVRLLSADTSDDPLLRDPELLGLLKMQGITATEAVADSDDLPLRAVRLAAADALEIAARSEAIVAKKIRKEDLATDGPAVAKELRESARGLRALVEAEDAEELSSWSVTEFMDY